MKNHTGELGFRRGVFPARPRTAGLGGSAFTLIELLIVVAIISILSSIAVPNFLEAQTRAKVSRVKADMKSMATALESYAVDHNKYPYRRHPRWDTDDAVYLPLLETKAEDLSVLTTPIAYMTKVPVDIFDNTVQPPLNLIDYLDPEQTNVMASSIQVDDDAGRRRWTLISVGPDGYIGNSFSGNPGGYPPQPGLTPLTYRHEYNPTNGTISLGNVYRLQGNADFYQVMHEE